MLQPTHRDERYERSLLIMTQGKQWLKWLEMPRFSQPQFEREFAVVETQIAQRSGEVWAFVQQALEANGWTLRDDAAVEGVTTAKMEQTPIHRVITLRLAKNPDFEVIKITLIAAQDGHGVALQVFGDHDDPRVEFTIDSIPTNDEWLEAHYRDLKTQIAARAGDLWTRVADHLRERLLRLEGDGVTVATPTTSPWGAVEQSTLLSDGLWMVSTAAHGGLMLDQRLARHLSDPFKRMATTHVSHHRPYACFEEDVDWAFALLELQERFEFATPIADDNLEAARQLVAHYGPSRAGIAATTAMPRDITASP
jgi:hypothetical protein